MTVDELIAKCRTTNNLRNISMLIECDKLKLKADRISDGWGVGVIAYFSPNKPVPQVFDEAFHMLIKHAKE